MTTTDVNQSARDRSLAQTAERERIREILGTGKDRDMAQVASVLAYSTDCSSGQAARIMGLLAEANAAQEARRDNGWSVAHARAIGRAVWRDPGIPPMDGPALLRHLVHCPDQRGVR
jgi:hypothetical protein